MPDAAHSSERIGFLGLGIMGSRMAANLARAGFPLTVWTHTPGKAERWAAEHGADACATPAEVARASDIVVSMVVDGAQVAEILLGADGRHRGRPTRACCASTARRSRPRTRGASAPPCASAACGCSTRP